MRKKVIMLAIAVAIVTMLLASSMLGNLARGPSIISPEDSPTMPSRGYFLGLLPTPGAGQSFADSYAQASEYCDFVPVWGKPSPFYAMASDLSGSWGDTFIRDYIRGNGMFPLIQFSFFGADLDLIKPPGMEDATLSDAEWRQAYKKAILDTVREVRPLYLSVGNEVNRWYEAHGSSAGDLNGFQHFVSLYEEIYDAVKRLSNETQVFCVFAREIVSEHREADLSVIAMFNTSKLDVLAFTSYPFAVQEINRASDIPDDYFSRALTYTPGKSLALTELGWPSLDAFGGEQGQADFLSAVATRLTIDRGADLRLLAWAWLHDINEDDHIGLIRTDGTEKEAYSVWKRLSAGR
ncbi:MAG: hypothetical protein QXU73_05690 [Thermoplasmata archaeon]